ncbi:hypothetical protein NIES2104_20260 [Leptolyngbya sp. NIES-2104]|nr:hypothetical protein NIES2104_20260 [Leptolyngbya sp. NIES-2104]
MNTYECLSAIVIEMSLHFHIQKLECISIDLCHTNFAQNHHDF